MRGSQSAEWKVRSGLATLGCSETAFCKIANFTHSNFSVIMAGEKDFTQEQAARLQELLSEMVELQLFVGRDIPVAWAVVDKIKHALCIQRIKRISQELGYEDSSVKDLVVDAPRMVVAPRETQAVLSPNGATV